VFNRQWRKEPCQIEKHWKSRRRFGGRLISDPLSAGRAANYAAATPRRILIRRALCAVTGVKKDSNPIEGR